jgi:hypothetical protein
VILALPLIAVAGVFLLFGWGLTDGVWAPFLVVALAFAFYFASLLLSDAAEKRASDDSK